MFEIVTISEQARWDDLVRSFSDFDVYYLSGYARGFAIHGDGEPQLLHYAVNDFRAICVVMKRNIPNSTDFYDIITPYGYGGFIFDGKYTEANLILFRDRFFEEMRKQHVVSAVFRYHPLLSNQNDIRSIFPVVDLGQTIAIDTSSRERIEANLISKNRNMIRKARKNGVCIMYGRGLDLFNQFTPIYNVTMDRDKARAYYYFGNEFYEAIDRYLADNYLIFYAQYNDQIIAMSIILFANKSMHYHLSGSLPEFRHLAPTNLLLYEAALWGADNKYQQFHLGGGVGSSEDNLFKFKQSFNRNSNNQFSISKIIFIPEVYNQLVEKRCTKDPDFDENNPYFPLYRA